MAIQTHKGIKPQFIAIRPMNLYKEWRLNSYDFATQSKIEDWLEDVTASEGGTSGITAPTFPPLNAKYARLYPHETGSETEPDGGGPTEKIIDEDGYMLSYNYLLGNNDKFYPAFQSESGWMNPDDTYARMTHYSLQKLFYGNDGVYKHLFFGSSSYLSNEAFVVEIPQRYVAETIEPGTFVLTETTNISNLPYTATGSNSGFPNNNTSSLNPKASEGIRLIDDSLGNLFDANYSESLQRGNIFYELGLIVITDVTYSMYFRDYTTGSFI